MATGGAEDGPVYRHGGGGMLRAAAWSLDSAASEWPTLSDGGCCRSWLQGMWALEGLAEAVRYASGSFAELVEAVIGQEVTDIRQVRRVTVSAIRYLLRSVGRPVPFGLFAGVAPVGVGGDAGVAWGRAHRLVIRADTLWLDDVV